MVMGRPRKPQHLRRRTFGVSMPNILVDRIDALVGDGERSEFLQEMVIAGIQRRYGEDWHQMADQLRAARAVDGIAA